MTTVQARPDEVRRPDAVTPVPATRRLVSVRPARSLGLSSLMARRPDLYGVYKPADVTAESILWSA